MSLEDLRRMLYPDETEIPDALPPVGDLFAPFYPKEESTEKELSPYWVKRGKEIDDKLPVMNGPYTSRSLDLRFRRSAARNKQVQYDGRICRKCKTTRRYTNRGACVQCVSQRNRANYESSRAVEEYLDDMFD